MKIMKKLHLSILSFLRWILFSIFITGIISANISKLIEQKHWDSWFLQSLAFLPTLTSQWWFWLVLGLIGGASLVLWIAKFLPQFKEWNENARLTLVFDNDLQTASPTKQEGVRYFYWYHFPNASINFDTRQVQTTTGYIIVFLALEDPTHTNYNRVRVIGGGISCEVVSTHCAGAVIRASGDMRGRTLDIWFSKEPIPID
jgi:hypothetical protein